MLRSDSGAYGALVRDGLFGYFFPFLGSSARYLGWLM